MSKDQRASATGLTRRQFLTGAALSTAAVIAGGCGSTAHSSSTPQTHNSGTSQASTGASGTGGGSGPKPGGTFRIGVNGGSSAETLDPLNAVTTIDLARVAQINETLLYFDNNFHRQYLLAESLEPNANATTWTLRLRDGIEFHNGKSLTAEDVVYTVQRIINPKSPAADAGAFSTLESSGLKAVDKRTVQFTFTAPYSYFPDVLALGATNAVRIVPVGFNVKAPVGTGPFVYDSFTPGQESEFTRNPSYWQSGKPYFDAVHVLDLNDDSARLNALQSGNVDAIIDVPPNAAKTLQSNGLSLLNSPTAGFNPLVMRCDTAPFNDINVRQAMRLIAGRPQIINAALDTYGNQANDLYGRYDPDYDRSLPQRQQDIQQAKKLLAKSGKDGMSVSLTTSNIAAGEIAAATVFAQQASAAGIKVTINQVEPTDFWSKSFMKAPFTVSNWASRTFLLQASASMMPNAPYNETHWSNAKWWKYVKEATAATKPGLLKELIHEAQTIEWKEGGYINWGWYNTLDGHSTKVHGFTPCATGLDFNSLAFKDGWFA